jgi:hypothetical protein
VSSRARGATAVVGVAEHGKSADLVTIRDDRMILDRRRVDLTPPGTPSHPHHHEGSWAVGRYPGTPGARPISLAEAVALVERVREAAARGAGAALAALAADVAVPIVCVTIRRCPELPASTEERIRDNRTQTQADSVMYRRAMAAAAEARGWALRWYERERVAEEAAAALPGDELDALLRFMGRAVGAPWQARQKLAATAAIAATGRWR